MIEPDAVCVSCGQPAAARSGIFNKVYRCRDCYASEEKKNWLLTFLSCGGCFGLLALMVIMGSCGAAMVLKVASG